MTELIEPDWSQSDSWDEFQWEEALKFTDQRMAQYFGLLERFGDLPNAEQFIAERLGDRNAFLVGDDEAPTDEFPPDDAEDAGPDQEAGEGPNSEQEPAQEEPVGPGDPFFYETHDAFRSGRTIALGWCNVIASVLNQEDRTWGLQVLFHLSRVLHYLAVSIGDGLYERVTCSTAFAKRTLHVLNLVLGELDRKGTESPQYQNMFKFLQKHLFNTRDRVVDLLFELRRRQVEGPPPESDEEPPPPPGGEDGPR